MVLKGLVPNKRYCYSVHNDQRVFSFKMPADSGSFPYKVGLYLGAVCIANLKSLMCDEEMCTVLFLFNQWTIVHVFNFDMFYTDVIYEVIYTIDNNCILCKSTCLSRKTRAKRKQPRIADAGQTAASKASFDLLRKIDPEVVLFAGEWGVTWWHAMTGLLEIRTPQRC